MSRFSVLEGSYIYQKGEEDSVGNWDLERNMNMRQNYVEEEEDSVPENELSPSRRKKSVSRMQRKSSRILNAPHASVDVDSLDSTTSLPPYGYLSAEADESWMGEVDVIDLAESDRFDQSYQSSSALGEYDEEEEESVRSDDTKSAALLTPNEVKRRLGIVTEGGEGGGNRKPVFSPVIAIDEEITIEDLQEAFSANTCAHVSSGTDPVGVDEVCADKL